MHYLSPPNRLRRSIPRYVCPRKTGYHAPDVLDVEIAGNRIMTNLLDHLLQAVLHPDRVASRLLLAKVPEQYNVHAPDVYGKVQSVLDHLSAMTDVYALDLYRKLNGHSLPAV